MAEKNPTHVVSHPKVYLAVSGKLQHVPIGTEVVLSAEATKKAGKKFSPIGEKKSVDLTQGKPPSKMTVEELKAGLDEAKIPYTADDKKPALIKLLEGAAE